MSYKKKKTLKSRNRSMTDPNVSIIRQGHYHGCYNCILYTQKARGRLNLVSRDMDDIQMIQMEVLEMKTIVTEMEHTLDGYVTD